MGEHFHLEFLWEWAAGSATLNHSILQIQAFPPVTAKQGPHSGAETIVRLPGTKGWC